MSVEVTEDDPRVHIYNVEIYGGSQYLALQHPGWGERHRIYIVFAIDATLEPSATIFTFESMEKTGEPLFPIDENSLDYIPKQSSGLVEPFQKKIKDALIQAIRSSSGVAVKVHTKGQS